MKQNILLVEEDELFLFRTALRTFRCNPQNNVSFCWLSWF